MIGRVCLFAAVLWSTAAVAETNFSGYLKSFAIARDSIDISILQADRLYQSQNSARFMWDVFTDHAVWQLHYEVSPIFSSTTPGVDLATFASPNAWRLTDVEHEIGSGDRRQVFENLDRLNVQFNFKAGDLTIGRQPITFGVSRVINPTDVFLPFDVRTFNQEYRIGVDGVRFQHPMGQLGEVDVGVITGHNADADTSAAFLQVRTNVGGHDLQFAVSRFARQTLLGGGVQTSLGNFGFWLEAAQVSGEEDYLRLSTGLDYAFSENIYGLVEYHYNGAGSDTPADYIASLDTAPYRVGGVFLLGKHYLIPAVSVQLTPLWSLSLQSLANLSDRSMFLSLSAVYNVTENAYMDFGFYYFPGQDLTEYGSNPATLYASLRYYF